MSSPQRRDDKTVGTPEASAVSAAPELPPDGGFWAWMSVLSGFLIVMNTWGVFISFGVFQTYYVTNLGRSASDIAWIGSFEIFLLFLFGSIAGSLTDRGYFRAVVMTGSVLIVIGTFTTSVSKAYWQVFLAQGVCTGLGNGLIFTPIVAVISTYFTKKRPVALASMACGSTVGGLIFPSMARTLLPSIGFRWTMQAIGFIQLGTLAIAVAVARPRATLSTKQKLVDWDVFKDLDYTFYVAGASLTFVGMFVPFFYLANYARVSMGFTFTKSLNLLLVLNGVGIIGRLAPSIIARWLGVFNVFSFVVGCTAIIVYLWSTVSSVTGLYIWTVFFSLCMGGIQSLFPAAVSVLRFDPYKQGTRMGMMNAAVSLGALIGPPVAGVLVAQGTYLGAQMLAGSFMIAGFVFVLIAREIKRRREGWNLFCVM